MSTHSAAGARARQGRATITPPSPSVSEAAITEMAEIFQMLSDGSRLKILLALARGDAMNVTELRLLLEQTQSKVSQPAVSHHLSLLRKTHLVRCDRQGKKCFYRLDSTRLRELLEQIFRETGNSTRQIQFEDLSLGLKKR